MRITTPFCLSLVFVTIVAFSNKYNKEKNAMSPLAAYSAEWNNPRYNKCNTAANASYLTEAEKETIYILNLIRANPLLFANTVVKRYPEKSGQGYLVNSAFYTGLLDTLRKLKPRNFYLTPDINCFYSAKCHALYAGATGYTGHERSTEECKSKKHFNAECCDYGHNKPLDIIMSLLIDEGVPSLGHREICLGSYKKMGVSIQAHQQYGYNTVLDFMY